MDMNTALARSTGLFVLLLVLGLLACGEDPVAPQNTSLVGDWFFVGFTDGARVGSTTGTWVFFDDGVMAVDISITFPNEGRNPIAAVGSFERMDSSVTFDLGGPDWNPRSDGSCANPRCTGEAEPLRSGSG